MAEQPVISNVSSGPVPCYTGFGGYGGYNNNDCLDSVVINSALSSGFQGVTNTVHSASVANMKETADSARDVISATNQLGSINLQATERNAGETRANIDRNAIQMTRDICDVRQEMAEKHGQVLLELSKCCCDIKELVRADGAQTRDILRSQALDAANLRASELQNELNLLKMAAA